MAFVPAEKSGEWINEWRNQRMRPRRPGDSSFDPDMKESAPVFPFLSQRILEPPQEPPRLAPLFRYRLIVLTYILFLFPAWILGNFDGHFHADTFWRVVLIPSSIIALLILVLAWALNPNPQRH